ncbi:MAG: type I polyketide synthase [Neomegalonema sp.]|nr:type I polyketide synthase [Neomegalonema sp.]
MTDTPVTAPQTEIPDGIAIIGMAGRFPKARGLAEFWDNIKAGRDCITHFSRDALEIDIPGSEADTYVCAKGILEDADLFDARFFGYTPREAEVMDPQHRIFLEIAWEALEHAGHDAARYDGLIGCFGGCYMDTYVLANLCADPAFRERLVQEIQVGSLQTELGNDKDYLATRTAFKLGLRGPAFTLQTACSTSLVAIATACQSLENYACDMALAGGVTLVLPQYKGYFYKEGSMLSRDGTCRPFSEDAAGTVFSNGAAMVALKRLADAQADGDTIIAVIKGYALNNDGGAKLSYTAPSVAGQSEVIALAMAMGGIAPETVGLIEAHGTATPLGDPIEVAGLTEAFGLGAEHRGSVALGSLKGNLGHMDVASGAMGVIKTALALREAVLPPSIHFSAPNPKVDWDATPFAVNTELRDWPAPEAHPRRAGVSSFGVGGTNAHVVLEEPPVAPELAAPRQTQILPLSAKTATALEAQAAQFADHLDKVADPAAFADAAWTAQIGRRAFEHRRILVAETAAEAAEALRAPAPAILAGRAAQEDPELVFLFPGQGAQYPGMGAGLYTSEPVYRAALDRICDALMAEDALGEDLRPYLLWQEGAAMPREAAEAALAQTRLTQPAIFAVEIALLRLFESWGLTPSAVLGHSIGEFAAAVAAGVLYEADAARLVARRGALMQALEPGQMLAVRASEAEIAPYLSDAIGVAAINGPRAVVLSGKGPAIRALAERMAQEGLTAKVLTTSHAFHSPMMAPARAPLDDFAARIPHGSPSLPFASTLTGAVLASDTFTRTGYWGAQLCAPVRFAEAVAALASENPARIFVEIGPGQALSALAAPTLAAHKAAAAVPVLGPSSDPGDDTRAALSAVGRLWCAGKTPDWAAIQRAPRRRVPLPTYPFERKRYWIDPPSAQARTEEPAPVAPPVAAAPVTAPPGAAPAEQAPLAAAVAAPAATPAATGSAEALIHAQLQLIEDQLAAIRRG